MASLQGSIFLTYLIDRSENGTVEDTIDEALEATALIETRQASAIKRCLKHKVIKEVSTKGGKRVIVLDSAQIALYQTPKSEKEPKQPKAKGVKIAKKLAMTADAPKEEVKV
jgi:hypothetical protein